MEQKIEKPTKPCYNCGGEVWWQRVPNGHFICQTCHPKPPCDIIKQ